MSLQCTFSSNHPYRGLGWTDAIPGEVCTLVLHTDAVVSSRMVLQIGLDDNKVISFQKLCILEFFREVRLRPQGNTRKKISSRLQAPCLARGHRSLP